MNGDLKLTFIAKILNEYGQELEKVMPAVMARLKVNNTGEGSRSISYKVLSSSAAPSFQLSFVDYLRFIDMGVGKAHPLGGLAKKKLSLTSQKKEGLVFVKDRVRKPKKFYSKVAYGKLNWMYNKLLYGYTEETIQMLKTQIQNGNN